MTHQVVVFSHDAAPRDEVLAVVQRDGARTDAAVVYLAGHPGLEVERRVRDAGVTYHAAKAARGRNLTRVTETALRVREPRGTPRSPPDGRG